MKQAFIVLLSFCRSLATKSVSLSNEPYISMLCISRPSISNHVFLKMQV